MPKRSESGPNDGNRELDGPVEMNRARLDGMSLPTDTVLLRDPDVTWEEF